MCKCFFLNPRVQRDGLRVQTPQRRALRSQEKTQDIKNEYHKVLTRRSRWTVSGTDFCTHRTVWWCTPDSPVRRRSPQTKTQDPVRFYTHRTVRWSHRTVRWSHRTFWAEGSFNDRIRAFERTGWSGGHTGCSGQKEVSTTASEHLNAPDGPVVTPDGPVNTSDVLDSAT